MPIEIAIDEGVLIFDVCRAASSLEEFEGLLFEIYVLSLPVDGLIQPLKVILHLELPLLVIHLLVFALTAQVRDVSLGLYRWLRMHHSTLAQSFPIVLLHLLHMFAFERKVFSLFFLQQFLLPLLLEFNSTIILLRPLIFMKK